MSIYNNHNDKHYKNYNPRYFLSKVIEIEPLDFFKLLGFLKVWCVCNIFKYLLRYPYKGTPTDDLYKAESYLKILISEVKNEIEKEENNHNES